MRTRRHAQEPAAPATALGAQPSRIAARGLTKRYGEAVAVDGLTLEVGAGEVFGLLGPNGAGKTTTILMLLGLTEPTAGTVRVCGLDPARDSLAVRRRVGYLPDDVGFYPALTGRENLRYTASLSDLPSAVSEPRIDALLRRVGLDDAADARVETYSKGMRQRLGIADALVKAPDVVVLDEPTAAIDPRGVVEVLELVRELADEGVTVLLASHLLHQVQQTCDRIGIFVDGRLVAVGTVDELAARLGSAGAQLELEVAGEADPRAALEAISVVTGARPDPEAGPGRWLVTAKADDRLAIAAGLAEAGLAVTHLRRRGDDLDAIYLRYFSDGQEDGHGRGR